MTKYFLKDRLLQSKLDNLSNGEFSKWLSEQFDITMIGDCIVFELMKDAAIELSVFVRPEAVEVIPEYTPDDWNSYPAVTPPEGVLMRVEARYGFDDSGATYRTCAIFENGAWRSESDGKAAIDHNGFYDVTLDNVKRFRPWE